MCIVFFWLIISLYPLFGWVLRMSWFANVATYAAGAGVRSGIVLSGDVQCCLTLSDDVWYYIVPYGAVKYSLVLFIAVW